MSERFYVRNIAFTASRHFNRKERAELSPVHHATSAAGNPLELIRLYATTEELNYFIRIRTRFRWRKVDGLR